jgi:hypothetical protein
MMEESALRTVIRQKLHMIASPHQHPRDAAAIADFIGYANPHERARLVELVIEESQKLHINVI